MRQVNPLIAQLGESHIAPSPCLFPTEQVKAAFGMPDKILITGASGFIAQHIVKLLVSKNYAVVGTVRLEAKGKKLQRNTSGGPGIFEYMLVPDIAATGAFDEVFEKHPDVSVVLHTASPCTYESSNPKEDLIVPATRGTRNMMSAIEAHVSRGASNIRRVVVTSSDAAIYSPTDEQNSSLLFDETCWNRMSLEEALKDPVSAYYGSKAFSEKIAWEFAAQPGFPPLTTVNPVDVFGPQAYENEVSETLNMSNEVVNVLFKIGPDGTFDNHKAGFVDVRDVAKAHLAAFEQAETVGKRLYMTNGHSSVQMMLDVILAKFPNLRGKVPVGRPGTGPADISSLARTNNDATRALLPFKFTLMSTCVEDLVTQILGYQQRQKL